MFDTLQERFGDVLKGLRGQARLTEDNIKDTCARCAWPCSRPTWPCRWCAVSSSGARAALGAEVTRSLTPGQVLIKIVNDELDRADGRGQRGLDLNVQPPAVILMAGLQGSGKTTSSAKLARFSAGARQEEGHGGELRRLPSGRHRAAAHRRREVGRGVLPEHDRTRTRWTSPAARWMPRASRPGCADRRYRRPAGHRRGHDAEIQALHAALSPVETLFVVDSMTGQDAAKTAKAFHEALPLTGVILTKADGDARGGAALSIREITGKPIKFLGVGEKTTRWSPSIRTASPRASSAWATSCRWSRRCSRRSTGTRPRSSPRSSRRARAST
jgi:signal recognition particle subunit SRP54